MKTYSLSEKGLDQVRRRSIKRNLLIASIILVIAIALNRLLIQTEMLLLFCSSILLAGALGFGFRNGHRKQLAIWKSVEIELGEQYIGRSQLRIPQIRLSKDDITSILESDRGIFVYTADKSQSLAIPSELDEADYQEIKDRLSHWATIEQMPSATKIKQISLNISLVVGLGIVFLSESLWVIVPVGILLLGFYGYLVWVSYQSTGVDPEFRQRFVLIVVFMALAFGAKVLWLIT